MMNRTCDSCLFEDRSTNREPCNDCGECGGVADKWQPAITSASALQSGLVDSNFAVNSDAMEPTGDPINHPPHYTQGGIECIDAIRAALTAEEWRGYCKGNAIKYIWRERYKGGNESISKADWYLDKMIDAEVPHGD